MDEVKENGSSLKDEALKTTDVGTEEQKETGPTVKGPGFGVNEEGYFFVQAHMSLPYAILQGTLFEASEFLREQHPNSLKSRMKRAEEKKIIQPQRGFRGFNLFGKR